MTQCIVVAVAGRAKAWQLRLSRSRGEQVIYSSPIESSCCCLLQFSSRKSLALGGVSRICCGQVSKNISIFISISFDFNFYCNTYAMRWFIRWRSCAAVFLCLRSIRNKSKNEKNDKKRRKNVCRVALGKVEGHTDYLLLDYFAECRQWWFMEQRDQKWALHKYRNKRTLKIRW